MWGLWEVSAAKGGAALLELEWQMAVCHPLWMLETERQPSGSTVWALNSWAISSGPLYSNVIQLVKGSPLLIWQHHKPQTSGTFGHISFWFIGTRQETWRRVSLGPDCGYSQGWVFNMTRCTARVWLLILRAEVLSWSLAPLFILCLWCMAL